MGSEFLVKDEGSRVKGAGFECSGWLHQQHRSGFRVDVLHFRIKG